MTLFFGLVCNACVRNQYTSKRDTIYSFWKSTWYPDLFWNLCHVNHLIGIIAVPLCFALITPHIQRLYHYIFFFNFSWWVVAPSIVVQDNYEHFLNVPGRHCRAFALIIVASSAAGPGPYRVATVAKVEAAASSAAAAAAKELEAAVAASAASGGGHTVTTVANCHARSDRDRDRGPPGGGASSKSRMACSANHSKGSGSGLGHGLIVGQPAWLQRKIHLRPQHRGVHLVTEEILRQVIVQCIIHDQLSWLLWRKVLLYYTLNIDLAAGIVAICRGSYAHSAPAYVGQPGHQRELGPRRERRHGNDAQPNRARRRAI